MDRNRRITFGWFLMIVIIYFLLQMMSCTAHRMKKPVDYSYAQDHRDSVIARVHHYEIKHKQPDMSQKQENTFGLAAFILISLVIFLLQL